MRKFFNRLYLVFTYGEDIDAILQEQKAVREAHEQDLKRQQLSLCEKHQQASPGTCYDMHNCNYCQLLERIKNLKGGI